MRSLMLATMLLLTGDPGGSGLGLSDEQRHRLDGGEVIVLNVAPSGGLSKPDQGGTGVLLVRASPDAVWRLLVDYRGHAGLYPSVVGTDVLEQNPDHALVRYVIGVGPFSFSFHIQYRSDAPRRRLVWHLAYERQNDLFRDNWGYWQVESHKDGAMLTYAMATRTVLPAFLTRGAERNGLIETLKAVRNRAERDSGKSRGPEK